MEEIIDTARKKQHVVISAPPATGKTAPPQLIRASLPQKQDGAKVVDVNVRKEGISKLCHSLKEGGIEKSKSKLRESQNAWLLLDDAQNAHSEEHYPFWQLIAKTTQGLADDCDLQVIISATHDPSIPVAPVQFKDLEHVHDHISQEEATELFTMFARVWNCEGWRNHWTTLAEVSRFSNNSAYIRVAMGGVRMLDR